MTVMIIDYAPLYYRTIQKIDVPPVVIGKFVQIRNESTEYLVFSPAQFTKYHANIVERFCLDNGIEGTYDKEGKSYDIFDQAWDVSGGGKYEIDMERKTLRLYDNSMAYGKFDKQHITEKVLSSPAFAGFTVLTE